LMVTSLLSLKMASPTEQSGGLGPPLLLFGSAALAPGCLGLEVDQLDEAAVLGYPSSCTNPADRSGASSWIHQSSAAQIFPASATCP